MLHFRKTSWKINSLKKQLHGFSILQVGISAKNSSSSEDEKKELPILMTSYSKHSKNITATVRSHVTENALTDQDRTLNAQYVIKEEIGTGSNSQTMLSSSMI